MAVHSFQHPRLTVSLSLGHKYNGWYLIFAKPYRTADSREISRLDASWTIQIRLVLLAEHQLAHYCENCGRWEVAGDNALRWFMVHSDRLPRYICPACHARDWFGARLLRSLKRLSHKIFC
ncbi:hypothetical protein R3P38DRAFT_3326598 [Favolaschia claudopus]|uniref:Uncharacterized protein n=1 Tax=Favolaschia claudopus TaxID=2862362 RepID=A0AAW0A8E7_9AGAR